MLEFVFQKNLKMPNQIVGLEYLKLPKESEDYPQSYIIEFKNVPIYELVNAY